MGKQLIKGVNDLESQYPNVAKEWDCEKNGGLKPDQVFAHSNLSYWWKCEQGHSYLMVVGHRTAKRPQGCPICANKKIVPGINDILTTHPDIAKHWDYEKNGGSRPEDYSAGSNDYVFWKCDLGHSFNARIFNMTHTRHGFYCPVCSNDQVLVGFNDLATTHPELVKEWDYEKNDILPTQVTAGMQKKGVWWKCQKYGHSWNTPIELRARRGLGCPICSNQRLLVGFNDLATLCPEILNYWDYDLNAKKPEDYIGTWSNKTIHLKCSLGHSWKTRIATFTRGNRCPICGNKIVLEGFNDLATTHPELVKEWDYEKNGNLRPEMFTRGSDDKVWWMCKSGHSWPATISSRVAGRGCPVCSKQYQTSIAEKAIAFYLSKVLPDLEENVHLDWLGKRELDIYIPSLKLGIEYDGHNFHKSAKKDSFKDKLCKDNGIDLIRIREQGCAIYESTALIIQCKPYHSDVKLLEKTINDLIIVLNKKYLLNISNIKNIENDIGGINERFFSYNKANSLEVKAPNLLKEWNHDKNGNLKPNLISAGSNSKVWWICEKGHEWPAVVSSRVRGNGCPYCSGKLVLKGFNDLASQYPALIKEWDYEKNGQMKPDEVLSGSNLKVWWKCEHGHCWETKISTRTRNGSGCPICAGLIPIKGENDFETLYPELAKEWDYEKNGELKPYDFLPGSEKVVWWKCPKGHSYDTQIAIRAKYNCGCPICNNKRVVKGINDLETLHPQLAAEWNYEKNEWLLPTQVGGGGGSHKKVWWKCSVCGHEWPATLASRISLKTGCPACAIAKIRKNK